jgi:hypothetical protein
MSFFKADIEYPFEAKLLITLDGVSPSHYKDTGVLPNSVAGAEGNSSDISP